MTAQRLDRTLVCHRVGDPDGAFPIFDATGSALWPGRWNDADAPLLYCCEHYSTALLEKLVRNRGRMPRNQHRIVVTIPRGASYEVFSEPALPGWDTQPPQASRAFGGAWARERRSLVLLVPSVVARPDRNVLLNPAHPEFAGVEAGLHEPVHWDRRLFGG